MFTTFWTLLNTLILIGLIIGVPWFMISVVRLLKKIVSRLERLEKTISEKASRLE
jgi:H+/gluconate symporter-like permease